MFSRINNVLFKQTSILNYDKPMSQSAPARLLGRDSFESLKESHFFRRQQLSFNSIFKYTLFPIVQIFPMALISHQRPCYINFDYLNSLELISTKQWVAKSQIQFTWAAVEATQFIQLPTAISCPREDWLYNWSRGILSFSSQTRAFVVSRICPGFCSQMPSPTRFSLLTSLHIIMHTI